MKICIIGSGYVGLVSGACFADVGNTVYCVDNNTNKINDLNNGVVPIYEPGLKEMIDRNKKEGRLIFTTSLSEGVNNSDLSFIAVGTPMDADGSADLRAVFSVCEEICKVAKKKMIIATKSTVPVGTGDKLESLLQEKLNQDFAVFSNPEFLKEGDAINDFMKPDRVIIGINDDSIKNMLEELYLPFCKNRNQIIFMKRTSSELTKYAANSMLALRISFMNELALLCDSLGANVHDVRKGIGSDPRIGPAFLYSGLGFGGSCFPKDVNALAIAANENGMELKTLEALNQVNKIQTSMYFKKICHYFGGKHNIKGKQIAVWGLAFKARTDDIRYSPSLKLIDLLLESGAIISAFDPEAMSNTKDKYHDKIQFAENKMDCLQDSEALVIGTEWNEFKNPDFEKIKAHLKSPVIFDGRNIYDKNSVEAKGFEYFGVGVN